MFALAKIGSIYSVASQLQGVRQKVGKKKDRIVYETPCSCNAIVFSTGAIRENPYLLREKIILLVLQVFMIFPLQPPLPVLNLANIARPVKPSSSEDCFFPYPYSPISYYLPALEAARLLIEVALM